MAASPAPKNLSLSSKPNAPITYTLYPGTTTTGPPPLRLIVFLNGLGLPASSWSPAIAHLRSASSNHPPLLTYDRFGQGLTTARDPLDKAPGKDPRYGHNCADVVHDLTALLHTLATTEASLQPGNSPGGSPTLELLLVAGSIGCPLARLFAAANPGTVAGLLLLDSNIANREFADFYPAPSSPGFDPAKLDCTVEEYVAATGAIVAMFSSAAPNAEGLDRRTLKALLPEAGTPRLVGPGGKGPDVVVVGHDPVAFAEQSFVGMKTPRAVSYLFTQPAWDEYNQGLLGITDPERSRGVIVAKGCGHFIQRDDPLFVAAQLKELLVRLVW